MSANTSTLPMPPIVDIDSWQDALQRQAQIEDELQEHIKIAAAARRRMPMTPVQGNYTFTGPDGEVGFADLFDGKHQLAVYHFMYAPDWSKGCPHCTQHALAQGSGINSVVNKRDLRYIMTSRAPYEKLAAWAEDKAIATPWYSASTEFSEEMGVINDSFGDFPGLSIFFRDDDNNVYRTWKAGVAGIESTMPTMGLFRTAPYGLQETDEDSPDGWPQPFEPIG